MDRKKILNDELEGKASNLEQEFEQYKIRAQSVLKQVKDCILRQSVFSAIK